MKNVIFLTYLNLWSMENKKGAPSFYKTIEAYIKDKWNVILINPEYDNGTTPKLNGLNNITFKPVFYPLTRVKKVSFFGRILNVKQGNSMLYKLGHKALKNLNDKALIYCYEVDGVAAGKRLSQKFNLPIVTRFQGTILDPIEDNWLNRMKLYPHFEALETKADVTIMTDDGTHGDKVLKRLGNKSEQIMFWKNGVDIDINEEKDEAKIKMLRNSLNVDESYDVLMTICRLASWKKVNRAIEALSVVVKERPKCKLIIVGDGEEKQNLMELANRLNLTSNVIFAGAVSQNEIKSYLDLADIFLSLYDLSNVGNPLLEAMACGKPIITLDVGDTSSIIKNEENGILLNVKDLNKIPEYIDKMLNDKNYADNLGESAKEYARKHFWSWDERMKAELDVINKLYSNMKYI